MEQPEGAPVDHRYLEARSKGAASSNADGDLLIGRFMGLLPSPCDTQEPLVPGVLDGIAMFDRWCLFSTVPNAAMFTMLCKLSDF